MSIGLRIGTVSVEPHRIEWEIEAQEMIARLKSILQDDVVDAQHIGSTSIKSICAKPIVDIVVGVTSFDKMMRHNDDLMKNGIVYRKEYPLGQHLYVCGDLESTIQTHYIHVVIWGEEAWKNYINMRDYLNAHEKEAKEYSDLKEHLAEMYPEDRKAYTNGKSAFIEKILQMADKWRRQV
jgi:GrpB-like predicted nucleotidyltransferase (UPF0157 family)